MSWSFHKFTDSLKQQQHSFLMALWNMPSSFIQSLVILKFSSITWTMCKKRQLKPLYISQQTFLPITQTDLQQIILHGQAKRNTKTRVELPQVEIYSYLQTIYCFTKYTFSTSRKVIWCNEFSQNLLHLENCKVNNLLTIIGFSVWLTEELYQEHKSLYCKLYTQFNTKAWD